MAESFLEEQLARLKRLTEKMTQAQNSAADLSNELERGRYLVRQTPLHDVRDYRLYTADGDHVSERHTATDAPRRRRRRGRR
jgi:hypothetical protein